jgi:hypothetical protein
LINRKNVKSSSSPPPPPPSSSASSLKIQSEIENSTSQMSTLSPNTGSCKYQVHLPSPFTVPWLNRSKFSLHWVTPQVSKGTTVSVARINHPLEVHWGSPHAELDMGPIPVKNGENWTWAYPSSSIFHLHRTQSNPALLTKASVTPLTLQFLGHPQTTAVLQPA